MLIHPSSPLSNTLFWVIHPSNNLFSTLHKGVLYIFKGESSLRVLADTLFGCFCSTFLRVTHPYRVSQFNNYSLAENFHKCKLSRNFLLNYRKSLINSPWAINFLTQGLLLVRAPEFIFNKPYGFLVFFH